MRDIIWRRSLDEPTIAYVMAEVLRGLVYLHRSGIIHRDIKAANILASREQYWHEWRWHEQRWREWHWHDQRWRERHQHQFGVDAPSHRVDDGPLR